MPTHTLKLKRECLPKVSTPWVRGINCPNPFNFPSIKHSVRTASSGYETDTAATGG